MERGIFLEPFILKKYNLEKNTNFTKPQYVTLPMEDCKLAGQCDGKDCYEIVEIKTRINIGVTDADRCQVQCYMEMYGAERCRFIELNQEGFLKETLIESKPEEWDRIIQAIERFMNNAHNLGREDILNLLREEEASEMQ